MKKLRQKTNLVDLIEDSKHETDDIQSQDFLIKDSLGRVHLVVIKNVEILQDGKIKFEYTSASNLDEYGLTDHLEDMVRKYYLGEENIEYT